MVCALTNTFLAFVNTGMANHASHIGYKQLRDVQIAKCLTLHREGETQETIAKELGCNQSTVCRILSTYDYETFTGRVNQHGRPRKTSEADDRHLAVIAKRNYDRPLADITNLSTLPISVTTATRRLKEVDLVSRYKRKKPFLSKAHKEARLEWARTYQNWTPEDWSKVIFSDECLIRVGVDTRRQRVIRPPGAALDERYLQPTFKSGRVTIMIWGCFCYGHLGPLVTLEQGGIDADKYEEILNDGLFSLVDDLLALPDDPNMIRVANEDTLLFMHDNAPCHKTESVKRLLTDNHIPVMKWPPQSPDLNPIENLWPELKHNFYLMFRALKLHPQRSQDAVAKYMELLQEAWQEIGMDFISTLVKSMPQRCKDVIAAKGGHTKR